MFCRLLTFRFKNTIHIDQLHDLFAFDDFSSTLFSQDNDCTTLLIKHTELSRFHNFDYKALHAALEQDSDGDIRLWVGRIFPNTIDVEDLFLQHQAIFKPCHSQQKVTSFEQAIIPQLVAGTEIPFYIDLSEELVDTSLAFIASNLNASQAAADLYMHRNTLNYRLDKIVTYSGIDIRTFEGALVFYLYYK